MQFTWYIDSPITVVEHSRTNVPGRNNLSNNVWPFDVLEIERKRFVLLESGPHRQWITAIHHRFRRGDYVTCVCRYLRKLTNWELMYKKMKKSDWRRRKHCALAVVRWSPKNFRPASGARRRWSLPLPTDPVWWGSMHAISSYRGNRPTNTHKHTDRGDYNTLCRS